MLTALTATGKQVVLTRHMSLPSLRHWRKNETFHCPQCKEQLLLKVGDIVISEGESPTHLLGKIHLYELFTHHQLPTEMESYLPNIKQRPDLLVTFQDQQVPIEFQCSTIPITLIEERDAGYNSLDMSPIWIIVTPTNIQTTTASVVTSRIPHFEQYFIRQIESPNNEQTTVFLTYNPSRQQFHYLSHFIHLRGTAYVMCHSIMRIKHQTIPFAVPANPTPEDIEEMTRHYRSARQKRLRSVSTYNQRGINHRFLRACYEMRIQPSELPSWIGVPTLDQEAFSELDCEWQLLLIAVIRQTVGTPFKINRSIFHSFVKTFEGDSVKQLAACNAYVDFLKQQRIDIYRLDKFNGRDFIIEILSGRFLAMRARY